MNKFYAYIDQQLEYIQMDFLYHISCLHGAAVVVVTVADIVVGRSCFLAENRTRIFLIDCVKFSCSGVSMHNRTSNKG